MVFKTFAFRISISIVLRGDHSALVCKENKCETSKRDLSQKANIIRKLPNVYE